MLIELRTFARFPAWGSALLQNSIFERDEVMLFLVLISHADQVCRFAVQPVQMRWVHRILHGLKPVAVINLVLLDPAFTVLPAQYVPARQQRSRLRSQIRP